jgi:hypothetical protein
MQANDSHGDELPFRRRLEMFGKEPKVDIGRDAIQRGIWSTSPSRQTQVCRDKSQLPG